MRSGYLPRCGTPTVSRPDLGTVQSRYRMNNQTPRALASRDVERIEPERTRPIDDLLVMKVENRTRRPQHLGAVRVSTGTRNSGFCRERLRHIRCRQRDRLQRRNLVATIGYECRCHKYSSIEATCPTSVRPPCKWTSRLARPAQLCRARSARATGLDGQSQGGNRTGFTGTPTLGFLRATAK